MLRAHKWLSGALYGKYVKKRPLKLIFYPTFRCNSKCKYCGLWRTRWHEMSTEEVKRALNEFSEAGTLSITLLGGEPLLRSDIGEIINHCKKLGFSITLITNGRLIKWKINEIRAVDYLFVSIDGPREINDKLRGQGSFESALKGIQIAKENGIETHISATLSKENVGNAFYGVKFLLHLAKELGCNVEFTPVYSDLFNRLDRKKLLSKNECKKAVEFLKNYKKQEGIVLDSYSRLDWFGGKNRDIKCYGGTLMAVLFPNGDVAPCCFKPELAKNGMKSSFSGAFGDLKNMQNCHCNYDCFVEYNLLFSLHLEPIINAFINYPRHL